MTSYTCHVCGDEAHTFDSAGGWCEKHWRRAEAATRAREKRLTRKAGGPWPQTCPRRMSEGGPWEREENLDTWSIRAQFHRGLVARHCDFCGSLHPDDLIRLIREEGYGLYGTDKGYKAYVRSPDGREVSKVYLQHLSVEQRVALRRALLGEKDAA